jgi:uncharacterized protein
MSIRNLITRTTLLVLSAGILSLAALAQANPSTPPATSANAKPKVRAITGFVRLERAQYQQQLLAGLKVLRQAESEFVAAGYEVETVRITTQPLAELVSGLSDADALSFLKELDQFSVKEKFLPNVGPGMLHDSDSPATMHLLAQALSQLSNVEGSSIIASADGIHWNVIRETAALVKYVAEHSPHSQGNFNFTATAMLQPYSPFFPGSYHTGSGQQFAIGFEGANLVQQVFARTHGNAAQATSELTRALTEHSQVAERIGKQVESETGWKFMGVDPTPAPLADVSIGAAIESYTGVKFGSSGTMAAARIITDAVKAVPVKQTGYSGLMLPVMEDKLLAQRWAEGTYNIDSVLAYSAVCGTGLDTVPLPGDITTEQMTRIFADVAALATKWNKPLSARLQPVTGKRAGERTEFDDPYLFNTLIHPVP